MGPVARAILQRGVPGPAEGLSVSLLLALDCQCPGPMAVGWVVGGLLGLPMHILPPAPSPPSSLYLALSRETNPNQAGFVLLTCHQLAEDACNAEDNALLWRACVRGALGLVDGAIGLVEGDRGLVEEAVGPYRAQYGEPSQVT